MTEIALVLIVGTVLTSLVVGGGYFAFVRWQASENRRAERFRQQNRDR